MARLKMCGRQAQSQLAPHSLAQNFCCECVCCGCRCAFDRCHCQHVFVFYDCILLDSLLCSVVLLSTESASRNHMPVAGATSASVLNWVELLEARFQDNVFMNTELRQLVASCFRSNSRFPTAPSLQICDSLCRECMSPQRAMNLN